MDAFGPALIYLMLLVVQVIVATFVACFAAQCFLVIVQETAAGQDEIVWPKDPYYDWLWKPPYLAWLVIFWVLPVSLVIRLVLHLNAPGLAAGHRNLILMAGFFVGLWLLFPVSLLSSLSGSSQWMVFRPAVLRLMARRPNMVVAFYAISGVLLTLCAVCLAFYVFGGHILLLPVVVVLVPTVLFIYARLLGRVAGVFSHIRLPSPKGRASAKRRTRPVVVEDPWQPPSVEEVNRKLRQEGPVVSTPLDGPVESYGLADETAPAKKRAKKKAAQPREEPPEPYGLSEEDPPPRHRKTAREGGRSAGTEQEPDPYLPGPEMYEPSEFELRLARGGQLPPPPQRPMTQGVFHFPWYPASVGPWLTLVVGLMVWGILYEMQRPFGEQLRSRGAIAEADDVPARQAFHAEAKK